MSGGGENSSAPAMLSASSRQTPVISRTKIEIGPAIFRYLNGIFAILYLFVCSHVIDKKAVKRMLVGKARPYSGAQVSQAAAYQLLSVRL